MEAHWTAGSGAGCSRLSGQTTVSAVFKKVKEAITESDKTIADAEQNSSQANVEKAQAAMKKLQEVTPEFEKAVTAYEEWQNLKCRENEGQAYQAGIDACQGAETQERCADL